MTNFYQTTNKGLKEPAALAKLTYIHVKCKADGSSTLIITDELINDPAVLPIDQATMKQTLAQWANEENQSPGLDRDGNPILQIALDPQIYLDEKSNLRDVSTAIATVQKIERGFVSASDDQIDLTPLTILFSPIEKEIFQKNLTSSKGAAEVLVDPKSGANAAPDAAIAADAISLENP